MEESLHPGGRKILISQFLSTEMQVMDLFELNDHFYNDDPDVPFWEFQLKVTKAPSFGSDPNQNSVFIKNVPLPLSRADFVKSLSQMAGYVSLTLSEPNKLQNYTRIGWASFDGEEYCNHCVNQESITIKGHVLQFQKQKEKKQNAISDVQLGSLLQSLNQLNLQQQRELIKVWMRKKQQVVVPQLMDHQKTEITQHSIGNQLDIQTLYLRRTIVIVMELNSQTIDYLCLKQAMQVKSLLQLAFLHIRLKKELQFRVAGYLFIMRNSIGNISNLKDNKSLINRWLPIRELRESENPPSRDRSSPKKPQLKLNYKKIKSNCINFAPRVQQRHYKGLDSIAQDKTQPAIMFQIRETKVNYNDI